MHVLLVAVRRAEYVLYGVIDGQPSFDRVAKDQMRDATCWRCVWRKEWRENEGQLLKEAERVPFPAVATRDIIAAFWEAVQYAC